MYSRMKLFLLLIFISEYAAGLSEKTEIWEKFINYYSNITAANGYSSFLVSALKNGVNSPYIIHNQCHKDIDKYINGITDQKGWALQMLDASSHMQSGFLEGNIADYGNYDECLKIDAGTFQGQFCQMVISDSSIQNLPDSVQRYPIVSSICVPTTCQLFDLIRVIGYGLTVNVQYSIYACDTKENHMKPYNRLHLSIVILFSIVIFIVIISTLYDMFSKRQIVDEESELLLKNSSNKEDSTLKRILLSFSLYKNVKTLVKEDAKSDTIKSLHALRCFSACGVMCVHLYLFDPQQFTNLFSIDKEMRKWYRMVIFNAYLWVDVFFLMSGLLISYGFLLNSENKRKLSLWRFYLHRYLRLTPTLVGVIAIALMIRRLCAGPHCHFLNILYSKPCEDNWLLTLTYVNNIVDQHNMCMIQAWYLAADMQMYLFAPVLLYIIIRWPRGIFYALTFFFILAKAYVFTVAYLYKLRATYIAPMNFFRTDSELIYNQSYGRIGPWLLGFGLGIILHQHNENPKQMTRNKVRIGWILSVIFCLAATFGLTPFVQKDRTPHLVVDALFKTFYREIWTLGVAWIIYACHTGNGGWMNSFLSSYFFHPLSKLTYSFYLIHTIALYFIFEGSHAQKRYFDIKQFAIYVGVIHISIIMSLILHLLIEAPSLNLERLFFKRKRIVVNREVEERRGTVKEA